MRTTLNIADDIYEAARVLARTRGRSLGAVISELARRGLGARPAVTVDRGSFPTFEVPDDVPIIPADRAEQLVADEGLE